MFFKPRIFISSTFKENETIRNNIEQHFLDLGAEPLLYEKNLTPSSTPYTYRTDIAEADFAIFIIKDKYGTKTESGLSGTHEELEIAFNSDMPCHVYVKLDSETTGEKSSKELRDFVDKAHASFFYYSDDEQLLQRIKETTFTIAKEAAIRSLTKKTLDKKTSASVAANYDYDYALGCIRIMDGLFEIGRAVGFVETNIIYRFFPLFESASWMFIDNKLEDQYNQIGNLIKEFTSHNCKDYTVAGQQHYKYPVPSWGEISVSYARRKNPDKTLEVDYDEIVNNIFKAYTDFCEYVKNMKFKIDKMNYQF